jgi:hypothetical protein
MKAAFDHHHHHHHHQKQRPQKYNDDNTQGRNNIYNASEEVEKG